MDLFKANIFKSGAFKQAKYLISVPLQTEQVLLISETGIGSLERLPLSIGYVVARKVSMAWNIIQKLKVSIEGVEGLVTPISERSRIPLDPYGKLTEEERNSLASLDTIHGISYMRAFARLTDKTKESPNAKTVTTIIWILGVLIGIALVGILIRGGS